MRARKIWQALTEAWDRVDRATVDSEGNPIPVHFAFAWLIAGILSGCGLVVVGAVLAVVAWYLVGSQAVWQASVAVILILIGVWQIEGGMRQTTVYIKDKKARGRV